MARQSLFAQLLKRKVVQVAAIYVAVAWVIVEMLATVDQQMALSRWVFTLAAIVLCVGFPLAIFLAWTFDITPQGIRRTALGSRRGKTSIALATVFFAAGTAGLFFLFNPAIDSGSAGSDLRAVLPESVAVLPFEYTGNDPRDSHFGEGLSDELRDQLARVPELQVTARSSSIAASVEGIGAGAMAARLGVANLVEGSLQRQGNVLKVSVELIEGTAGRSVWSETFSRTPRELLSIQQSIAETVVHHILPELTAMASEPATQDPTANELMLLARHYEQQVRDTREADLATLEEAVRLYRAATEADPSSALAHSRLAGALLTMADIDAAEAAVFQALSLAPHLSEVQTTLGDFYRAREMPDAGAAWGRAVKLGPNSTDALHKYAKWRWSRIDIQGVAAMFRHSLQLDPLNLERYDALGTYLALESYSDQAREVANQVSDLFDEAAAYRLNAKLQDYLGDVDRSIAWTIKARDLEPDNPSHVTKLAEYYADIGDFNTALRLDPDGPGILFRMRNFEPFIEKTETLLVDQPQDHQLRAKLAIAYNATGQFDSAILALQSIGLPESVAKGWRSQAERNGFVALMNAVYGDGEIDLARELAQQGVDVGSTVNNFWLVNVSGACQRAVLGQDDKVREYFQRLQKGLNLVWDPILLDSPCFERFADDPDYLAAVRHYEQRRAMLLKRLPATLDEFGVAL